MLCTFMTCMYDLDLRPIYVSGGGILSEFCSRFLFCLISEIIEYCRNRNENQEKDSGEIMTK